jgi:hypothetical protein
MRAVFCKLLRPEFTRTYARPLCADAFTRWDADPEVRGGCVRACVVRLRTHAALQAARQNAKEIVEATQFLYKCVLCV